MQNTIEDLIKYGIEQLEKANIEDAKLKAKILLAFLLSKPKEYLIIHKEKIVEQEKIEQYKKKIEQLKKEIPIQYITHKQEFMGLIFYVDENVLIPRFDTEILAEEIIKIANMKENLKILDMCTGSGAIAISLAHYIKNSRVYATDISSKALEVAKKNSEENYTNIKFIHSDMFSSIIEKDFDIIVSNPPYIETSRIEVLNEDVKKEPAIALDGGNDGLNFYRILANNAYQYLKPNGILAVEIGYNQKDAVMEILENTKKYERIYSKQDLGENNRVIIGFKK